MLLEEGAEAKAGDVVGDHTAHKGVGAVEPISSGGPLNKNRNRKLRDGDRQAVARMKHALVGLCTCLSRSLYMR